MCIKPLAAGVLGFAACVLPGLAGAEATGNYMGLTLGQSTFDGWDSSAIDDGSVLSSVSVEDSDTSFRLFGGIKVNDSIAFEVGYSDFGEATAKGTSDGSGFFWAPGPVAATAAADGLDLGLVARLPTSDTFAVFGKVGFLMWDIEQSLSDSTGSFSVSDDGNDVFFGFGGEFGMTSPLGVRAEYTMYSFDDADLDTITLSLVYRLQGT